jgi:hypothetical protein
VVQELCGKEEKNVILSIPRLVVALAFYVHMNTYFGWNATPHSPEECITDGIFCLLFSLSFKRKPVAA